MTFPILSGPFRGAPIHVDWRGGKRKSLGIYEHELNGWWNRVLPSAVVYFDVGAADGYLCHGVAHRIRSQAGARIVAFEPGSHLTGITPPKSIDFCLVNKPVGSVNENGATTLDNYFVEASDRVVTKIDVEGAEADVLAGATQMLGSKHHEFVVEVHGRHRVDPVTNFFIQAGRRTSLIEPQPHWLFGAESRSEWTGWVVTEPEIS